MKIREYLETIFGYRIAEDGNIKSYIDKLDRLGRFGDKQQKEIVIFLLTRIIKLEERLSLVEEKNIVKPETVKKETKDLHIATLWKMAREKGIPIKGKKREELIALLEAS